MDILDTFPKMQMLHLCLTLCVPVFFFAKVYEEDHLISSFCLGNVYRPSGGWGTRSLPATPHRLQHCTACNTAPLATPHRLQHWTACNTTPPATTHSLQLRTACNATLPAKSKIAARGCKNGQRGLINPRLLVAPNNFRFIGFLIRAPERRHLQCRCSCQYFWQ